MEESGAPAAPARAGASGSLEAVSTASPGRINLIGEHIDYLGGEVMPVAIDRHVRVEAEHVDGSACEISARVGGEEHSGRIDYDALEPRSEASESWLNYPIGILALAREGGVEPPGMQVRITSDLPIGAGLSSSAALETAFSLAVDSLAGIERTVLERARLCREAEHRFAGVPCGIMDQIAVGAGKEGSVLRIDCEKEEWVHFDLPEDWALVVADTGVKHRLGDGEYRKRREQCEEILEKLGRGGFPGLSRAEIESSAPILGDFLYRRARHVVSEMERVAAFGEAVSAGDAAEVGRLLRDGHDSLRDDFEVSCVELDTVVDAAYQFGPGRGLVGARMTGGGFGGSVIALVREGAAEELIDHLRKIYRETFGRDLDSFVTRAVAGAAVVPA